MPVVLTRPAPAATAPARPARRWVRHLWVVPLLAAAACLLSGALDADGAAEVGRRTVPVLGFVALLTVVAEIAGAAGVFDVLARWAAVAGRGRTWRLWLLLALVAWACTAVLSLDTTAVLVTPVVLVTARRTGAPVGLLALTTVWLCATGSLLLPVSNLTNLLALDALGTGVAGYVRLAWAPALVAVAVTLVVVALLHRRDLSGRYEVPPPHVVTDRTWTVGTGAVCAALVPAFVSGAPVWLSAGAAAALLVALTAWRRPRVLANLDVPWRTLLAVLGLFAVVETAHRHGLDAVAARLLGDGSGFGDLLRTAAVGALASDALNNLPAYLALEPGASGPVPLMALLVGVGAAPLLTPWASLATLLWADRCRAQGAEVVWSQVLGRGLLLTVVVLPASVGALWLASG